MMTYARCRQPADRGIGIAQDDVGAPVTIPEDWIEKNGKGMGAKEPAIEEDGGEGL